MKSFKEFSDSQLDEGILDTVKDVAQLGRASALGAESRRFKSYHPDYIRKTGEKNGSTTNIRN